MPRSAARVAVVVVSLAVATGLVVVARRRATQTGAETHGLVLGANVARDAGEYARARGCGAARSSPTGDAMTTADGRTFHVWGPSSYDEAHAWPVVIAFHGWSSNGAAFAKWFAMEKHTNGEAFVVYPDSRGAQWDYAGSRDLDFVADILEKLAEVWCIDRGRVLAFGFSYGGRFANHLGCKRPDLVRAVVVGGGAWDTETGCAPLPVLVIHRTNDPSMRFAGGREAASRWASIDGCSADIAEVDGPRGCVAYRGCREGAVTFCEDRHGDASWPAGWNHTVREEYRALAWRWFSEIR